MRKVVFALLLLVVAVTSVSGQLSQARTQCTNREKASLDLQISAGTKIIQSGRETALNRAVAYYNRGKAYHDKGAYETAIADYTKALELNPKDADVYNNRGASYLVNGVYGGAIADYTKVIELKPRLASAYYNRGLAHKTKAQDGRAFRVTEPDLGLVYYWRQAEYDHAIADSDGLSQLGLTTL